MHKCILQREREKKPLHLTRRQIATVTGEEASVLGVHVAVGIWRHGR